MASNFKNKNFHKKSIIIISGVPIDQTPVVKSLINYNSNKSILTLEYKHKHRLNFLIKGLRLIWNHRKEQFFFVGIQTLPLIFIGQALLKNCFYWELESYKISDNNKLVTKILFFENMINWSKVNLIIPDEARWDKDDCRMVKRRLIIPNLPLSGNLFQKRTLKKGNKIKLIFYGNLDNKYVYVNEWIDFVKKNCEIYLLLVGRNFDRKELKSLPENIELKSQVSHSELLSMLKDFHFTIVGYRPIDFNHTFCVPNKLYEAFSFSLPVIANSQNPTLLKLINETGAGILINFETNIQDQFNIEKIFKNYEIYSLNAFNAYRNKYFFENYSKNQLDPLL